MWGNKRVTFAPPNDRWRMAEVAFGHSKESSSYSLNETSHCTAVGEALSPTLYAVFQEFGGRLLSLLSESDQSQPFVEGQLAQESIRGDNMLGNLKKTKTKWPDGRPFFSLRSNFSCGLHSSVQKKHSLDTKGMICKKVKKREILFHRDLALKL